MYTYKKRNRLGAGSIFFIALFIACTIGLSVLLYFDKGKFWDIIPFVSIPIIIISLILVIYNFVKRSGAGYLFIFFFLIFLCGLVLSSIFGPFALNRKAQKNFDGQKYKDSIIEYDILLENYPNSRFAIGALKNISFAYYNAGQYIHAIGSFDDSIKQGSLSYDDLEIKIIYNESYQKIAEDNYNNKSYMASAKNYLKAVEVLEDIIKNYPDTNEAFIATHKIPKLLFNSALSYRKIEDYKQEIEVLENLVENYSDSDYYLEANSLIITAYTNNAVRLVAEEKYSEGVEELLKTFDREDKNKDLLIPIYKKNKVFYNVPKIIIKDIAANFFRAAEYEKALFLYENIIEYYPESESEVTSNLVKSKLRLMADTDYTELKQSTPGKRINNPENCIIIIENNTPYHLALYLGGPEYKVINIASESEFEIEIKSGEYEIAAELVNSNILPYYGMITYEENLKYREAYSILEEEPGD